MIANDRICFYSVCSCESIIVASSVHPRELISAGKAVSIKLVSEQTKLAASFDDIGYQ